jgi:branched-chain amino acid transport system ATP-binding protein
MLEIVSLRSGYGPVEIIRGIDISVPRASVIGVLGPNGSGKTTLFKTISGIIPANSGKILFNHHEISKLKSQEITRLGLSQVPQGRMLFGEMSVYENLEMGSIWLNRKNDFKTRLSMVEDLFPVLRDRQNQKAALLSGGEQQMLAISRALMGSPELILLDEPSIGLAPKVFDQIIEIVRRINQLNQTTILISEQNVRKILNLVDYAYVLENGAISIQGNAQDLKKNEKIQQSYLGF